VKLLKVYVVLVEYCAFFRYNIFKDEQAIKLGIVSYLEKAYSGETVSIPAKEYGCGSFAFSI